MKMRIWVHALVKNEGRWLWYAIISVIDYVDKILLWDAGSIDSTVSICAKLAEKYPDKIIFKKINQSTGEEFAKVRQEMLDETRADE